MNLEVERVPRGKKSHRKTELVASLPSSNGNYQLEDGSIVSVEILPNLGFGKQIRLKADGPLTEPSHMQILREGIRTKISDNDVGKLKLTGTKLLHVKL